MAKFPSFIITLFVASAVVLSCNNRTQLTEIDGLKSVYIATEIGNEQIVYLSEVASKVDYIPLETTNESLLGNVTQFSLVNNTLYFPDLGGNKFCRFSMDGKYLGNLGSVGRAFGEFNFVHPFGFNYDFESGAETIFDRNKLIEYYPDGSINELDLKNFSDKSFDITFIVKHGNIYICAISNIDRKIGDLLFLDSEGVLIGEFPKGYSPEEYSQPEPVKFETRQFFQIAKSFPLPYRYNRLLMVTSTDNNTIFAYKPGDTTAYKAYYIDKGNYVNELNDQGNPIINMVSSFTRESDNYLFLTFNVGKYKSPKNQAFLTRFLFDKKSNQTRSLIGELKNDIDGGPSFWPRYISADGKMVTLIEAINFIDAAENSTSARIKEVAAKLTEESNPVIMVVYN